MTTNEKDEQSLKWKHLVTFSADEAIHGKIASLALALQAAHKGLHRLSKQNKQLKEETLYLKQLEKDFSKERALRHEFELSNRQLHKRLAELGSGIVIPKVKVFQDDHLAN